jgi:hypothetical protein
MGAGGIRIELSSPLRVLFCDKIRHISDFFLRQTWQKTDSWRDGFSVAAACLGAATAPAPIGTPGGA